MARACSSAAKMTGMHRPTATLSGRQPASRVIDRRNGGVQSGRFSSSADSAFEHDPEKRKPVLRKDYAPPKNGSINSI
jgi:hypothetical protein